MLTPAASATAPTCISYPTTLPPLSGSRESGYPGPCIRLSGMTFKMQATIVDAVRTPRGKGKRGKGALTEFHPQELFAQTLNRLAEKSGVAPADVGDVV